MKLPVTYIMMMDDMSGCGFKKFSIFMFTIRLLTVQN